MAEVENPKRTSKVLEPDDPWALPEFVVHQTPWKELSCGGKLARVFGYIIKIILLIALLYLFIVALDFMGSAFKLFGGKEAGKLFTQNDLLKNPVCGLMIGVLVTVLVQSSSTSTSIVITMTAEEILDIDQAVYIIMGANIGTSVTNTIVALGQSGDRNEFRRAFAGATVHDMFNWLCVCVLLPLEAITGALRRLTGVIIESFHIETNKEAKRDILKVVTKPFSSLVVKIDKKVIEKVALNVKSAESASILKRKCGTGFFYYINETKEGLNSLNMTINETVLVKKEEKELCKALFSYWPEDVGDGVIGAVLLVISLIILCVCLVFIVKLLHSMLKGTIAKTIKKVINADFPGPFKYVTGYVAILVGAGLTIVVQSSSIFTSAITPLVGIGVISIERMYPLTLGANIGTTATGILAALVNSGEKLKKGLQLALCHLFFNIFGIIIWYPIPFMRLPIPLSKMLGNKTAKHRWFALLYILIVFLLVPGLVFALSIPGWYVLLGVLGPIFILFVVIVAINVIQKKRPGCLPAKLRSWNFLPLWMHSLKPLDIVIARIFFCKCCRKVKKEESETQVNVVENGHVPAELNPPRYKAIEMTGIVNEGFAANDIRSLRQESEVQVSVTENGLVKERREPPASEANEEQGVVNKAYDSFTGVGDSTRL